MSVRKDLELLVTSMNVPLRSAVAQMDIIILLRNCHPNYRGDYALKLLREGAITAEQAKEFTDPRGLNVFKPK